MAERLTLHQKLAKIRKQVEVVQKNKSGYGYKYVTDDELLAKITGAMDKLGVSLIPNIVPGTLVVSPYTYTKTKKEKQKDGTYLPYEEIVNEFTSYCDMKYVWVDNADPTQTVEVAWAMVGQQSDASQCLGSGLTYSMRYFLLKFFNVATPEDDPDNWRSKQHEADVAEDKAIAAKTIEIFDKKVKTYLGSHPNKADEVKKLASRFAKGGNYFAITESDVADKLMAEFDEKFN